MQVSETRFVQHVQDLFDRKLISTGLTLSDLNDVTLPTPAANSTLRYSGGQWIGKSASCIEFPEIVLGDEDNRNANSSISIRGPTRTDANGATMYIENSQGASGNGSIILRHKRTGGYNDQFVYCDCLTYSNLSGTSVSVSINVPTGLSNSILFVSLSYQANIVPPVAATYNGTSMTQLLTASSTVSAAAWFLKNPAAGINLFACTNPSSVTKMILQYVIFRDAGTMTLYSSATQTTSISMTGLAGNESLLGLVYQDLDKSLTVQASTPATTSMKLPTSNAQHGLYLRIVNSTDLTSTISLASGFNVYRHCAFLVTRITPIPDFVLTKKLLYSTGFDDYSDYTTINLSINSSVALSLTSKKQIRPSASTALYNSTIILPNTTYMPSGYTIEFYATQSIFASYITFTNALGTTKQTVYFMRQLKIINLTNNNWFIEVPPSFVDIQFPLYASIMKTSTEDTVFNWTDYQLPSGNNPLLDEYNRLQTIGMSIKNPAGGFDLVSNPPSYNNLRMLYMYAHDHCQTPFYLPDTAAYPDGCFFMVDITNAYSIPAIVFAKDRTNFSANTTAEMRNYIHVFYNSRADAKWYYIGKKAK